MAVVGSDPVLMLTGPIPATRKVLAAAGMTVADIDVFEVNEAFAPVVLAWLEDTGAVAGADQPQRRRHRPRPPDRGDRRDPDDQDAARPRG